MRLVFGVLVVSYADASGSGTTDTGFVADLLEKNYHVFETFYELKKEQIAGILADSMAERIQMLVMGRPPVKTNGSFTYGADQKVEALFRAFLDANEMSILAARYGFILSAAAEAGVSHRLKRPYAASNNARPAFIDSGLFRASARVWTEE
jgi:hypothetical protein